MWRKDYPDLRHKTAQEVQMNITTRPLSTDEVVILVSKSPGPWKQIYFLAVYTGLRISDLMALPWQPDPVTDPVIEKKTKKPKSFIWTDLSIGHWKALYAQGSPREFLLPFQDPSTYRKRVQADCVRYNLNPFRVAFHSFRKSHAVIAYRDGGLLQAKSTMNHSSLSITERYIESALKFDNGLSYDKIFITGAKHD